MADKTPIAFRVNGRRVSVLAYPLRRLLDVLREDLELTGTKEGCGEGECGACSVLVDGELVNSCLLPVFQCHGARVETVEGLAKNGKLSGLQKAFLACGGAQCGICTPGMLMAAAALLRANRRPHRTNIGEALSGNLCRCTGYSKIIDSVKKAAAKR